MGPVNYQLKLPNSWKKHNVFHACFLSPYKETEIHGPNYSHPPPEEAKDHEEYEIEHVMKHKKTKNGTQYYVLWKGYPLKEATWEPEENLEHSQETLNEYWILQEQKNQ